MHYIRLLRPPSLATRPGREVVLSLVLAITTDLGDAFLTPDEPLGLSVLMQSSSADGAGRAVTALVGGPSPRQRQPCSWRAGMRVLKTDVALPRQLAGEMTAPAGGRAKSHVLCVRAADPRVSASNTDAVVGGEHALVMPIFYQFPSRLDGEAGGGEHIATRRLQLVGRGGQTSTAEVEEDIGESIARHVWDAGLAVTSLVAALFKSDAPGGHELLRHVLTGGPTLNVLELGTGVGIFGLGLAAILEANRASSASDVTMLLSDLPDGEERATANIQRCRDAFANGDGPKRLSVGYENLDWEDGRRGLFGEQIRARPWHLVIISDCTYNVDMLPALVETLSAIHSLQTETGSTRVLLATKPRHPSERALFDLMARGGWATRETSILQLPVLGGESETVEIYLFEKSGET